MTPSEYLDDRIEYWHTHDTGDTLWQFLNITQDEYAQWMRGEMNDAEFALLVLTRGEDKD